MEHFQAIVTTMRSGSSLCGHLLAEAGWIRYAGETHSILSGPDGVAQAIQRIGEHCDGRHEEAPWCDKLVWPWLLPDGGKFLAGHASRIYLLLRHPAAVWSSLNRAGWLERDPVYPAKQLAMMRSVVHATPPDRLCVIPYNDLTRSQSRLEIFGRALDDYTVLPNTGQPGWGDPGQLIRSGKIREQSLEDDVRQAMKVIWMDIEKPNFLRYLSEYRALLKELGREDLDLPLPEDVFDRVDGLCIGAGNGFSKNEEEVVRLTVSDAKSIGNLPLENDVLEWVWSEELVHRCQPRQLLELLTEYLRVLEPGGVLRLSTIDFNFLTRLGEGEDLDYVSWYEAQFLAGSPELRGGVAVANHLLRAWGHEYVTSGPLLCERLREAGFVDVREVASSSSELCGKLPAGFYDRERVMVVGTKAMIRSSRKHAAEIA